MQDLIIIFRLIIIQNRYCYRQKIHCNDHFNQLNVKEFILKYLINHFIYFLVDTQIMVTLMDINKLLDIIITIIMNKTIAIIIIHKEGQILFITIIMLAIIKLYHLAMKSFKQNTLYYYYCMIIIFIMEILNFIICIIIITIDLEKNFMFIRNYILFIIIIIDYYNYDYYLRFKKYFKINY